MKISLIAAIAENGVIGKDNDLIWRLPDDLKYFKTTTNGHPIIMGRKNYESIGRPLPGRLNIVMTRAAGIAIEGCTVVNSLKEALAIADYTGTTTAFIIGGAEIYKMSLDIIDEMHITHVHKAYQGDVHFPEVDWALWKEQEREEHEKDERHESGFSIVKYTRV